MRTSIVVDLPEGFTVDRVTATGARGEARVICVKAPEPRYRAVDGGGECWITREALPAKAVAHFFGPHAEQYARNHAAQLNREAVEP